ncbi:MAG: sugar nucleotide-binding protein [Cellvibrionaceae bacterium]
MASIASKRVLVVGPENGLVATVARELDAGNMPVTFVVDSTIDWNEKTVVSKLFSKQKPFMLLHEMEFYRPALRKRKAEPQRAELLHRSQSLAEACAKHKCIVMHLSDYHVFGGDTKNAYDENDPTAPLDNYGAWVAAAEQHFADRIEKHLVLRFSWLIDAESDNLFTRVLAVLSSGEEMRLSRYRRGAPTWRGDARRVISGVVRQVMAGAENWGCFHYCSVDSCNEWEFGREVEATLTDLRAPLGKIVADDVKENKRFPSEPSSATLNSRRIRSNFGVHGRSWRQGLKAQINHWLEHRVQKTEDQRRTANDRQ